MNALLDGAATQDVIGVFSSIGEENAKRIESLIANGIKSPGIVVPSADARSIKSPSGSELPPGSTKLVLTSPPYLGAQKYIRASSLSLGWLGLTETKTLRDLENQSIGREHFRKADIAVRTTGILPADELIRTVHLENPLRAHIASTYLCEMRDALNEIHRVLAQDGTLIMVTGSNRLCGRPFHTTSYLIQMALDLGFSLELELVDVIRSRGLMTRRNASASVIEAEAITVFRK
jgi:DNA modification methylase